MRRESQALSSRVAACRPIGCRPGARLTRVLGALALLALGACAGPADRPVTNSALVVQRAYAANAKLRGVADALDARLDWMLAERTAMTAP